MPRFHVPRPVSATAQFSLPEAESHHATSVLRLGVGDRLTVLDGAGGELEAELIATSKRSAQVRVLKRFQEPAPVHAVTLFQAVPKGKAMDWIVEKATELGAAKIVPVLTERTVVQFDPREAAAKREKWLHTAIEAIKQCGSRWLPEIAEPVALKQAMSAASAELLLVASLPETAQTIRASVAEFRARENRSPKSIGLFIGPEGDFTTEELALIEGAGARAVTLGPRVLRAETAAIASLAVVLHELLSLGDADLIFDFADFDGDGERMGF
jgi:16S rRNA (uracil1498-N3)-methyltransferase